MQLLRSDKIFVLFFVLSCFQSWSQEVIHTVTIHKINNSLFKVQYQLNAGSKYSVNETTLKIFRKRNGKTEEIFSKNIFLRNTRGLQALYWKPTAGSLKSGDEVQAKIVLLLQPSIAKQPSKTFNKIPVADAGNTLDAELPVTRMLTLNGSKSHDADGKIISSQWKQISGPANLSILNKDSLIAHITGDFKEGIYIFELSLKDNQGAKAVGRTILHVKPAPIVTKAAPPVQKKDTATIHPAIVHKTAKPRLKGGPANAAINLLVPGAGHYFVSGNYKAEHRKMTSFIPTLVYAGAIGSAFYFQNRANNAYKKYKEIASYREYQTDVNGSIIGVRGPKETEANNYFNTAKSSHQNALISLGAGGAVLIGDFVYTLLKGMKNKKEWKQATTSFQPHLFFSSNGSGATVGIQFKF